jgi:hypothetical protein
MAQGGRAALLETHNAERQAERYAALALGAGVAA